MITLIFEGTGVTPATYDEICQNAHVSQGNLPEGLIFHSATPTDTGILVVDVWESQEHIDAFAPRLMPALEAAGVGHLAPRFYQTHAVMGSGKVPAAV